jgi:HK97 family phage portal protein
MPALLARLGAAVKALAAPLQPGVGGSSAGGGGVAPHWWGDGRLSLYRNPSLPGSVADYVAECGDLWLNSAVMACIGWLIDNISEPRLQVVRETKAGKCEPVGPHPLTDLIARPNEHYDGECLLIATVIADRCDGNAFWYKGRDGFGAVKELWFTPPWEMVPRWEGVRSWIDWWDHRVDRAGERWEVEDVVHHRYGMDPKNRRMGLSRLQSTLREIAGDNRASTTTAGMLRNWGLASVLVTNRTPGGVIQPEDADNIKLKFRRTTGESAGDPIVLEGDWEAQQLGLSPQSMDLTQMRMILEDRICANTNVNAMAAGLTSGAAHKTYANYGEAIQHAYRGGLIPMLNRFARTATAELGPDFGLPPGEKLAWDYSQVEALKEQRKDTVTVAVGGYQGGLMTLNEGRAEIGLEPVDFGDEFLVEPAPEPVPEAAAAGGGDPYGSTNGSTNGRLAAPEEGGNGRAD